MATLASFGGAILVLLLLFDLTHLTTQLYQARPSGLADCRIVEILQKLVEKSPFWISPDAIVASQSMRLRSRAHFVRSSSSQWAILRSPTVFY